jgi:DNA polymerase I
MKKFVIIDGHNLIFRAFYGVAPLTDMNGNPSNAIYGFASMFFNILQLEKPDFIAMTFDTGKNFRHDIFPEYKGTRQKCPDDLKSQMSTIYEMVDTMDIPVFRREGYEADDLIGTLSTLSSQNTEDLLVHIISSDHDLFQLIENDVVVSVPQRGGKPPIYFQDTQVMEKLGVSPSQVKDFKGLAGDSSDNIKGVEGIGPKGASKLLQEFGNLENIYDNLDQLTDNIKKKLETNKESAFMSRKLATIICDIPIEFSLQKMKYEGISENILAFFQQFHFHTLNSRAKNFIQGYDSSQETENNTPKTPQAEQMSLFS